MHRPKQKLRKHVSIFVARDARREEDIGLKSPSYSVLKHTRRKPEMSAAVTFMGEKTENARKCLYVNCGTQVDEFAE